VTATANSTSLRSNEYAQATANAGGGYGGYGDLATSAGGNGAIENNNASAKATIAGKGTAYATVNQTGGNGGVGYNGANAGKGGDSTLTNAVSGQTNRGTLYLTQNASGGTGGTGTTSGPAPGLAGAGGQATSNLTFDDTTKTTTSKSVVGRVRTPVKLTAPICG
jgi:hypothetical protein